MIQRFEYKGPGYKYDANSWYAFICQSGVMIPIKQGTVMKLTEVDIQGMLSWNPYGYNIGIYRATVTYPDNNIKWRKLFRNSACIKGKRVIYQFYTHRELNHARELGLIIKHDFEHKNNYLKYERGDCIIGSQLQPEDIST